MVLAATSPSPSPRFYPPPKPPDTVVELFLTIRTKCVGPSPQVRSRCRTTQIGIISTISASIGFNSTSCDLVRSNFASGIPLTRLAGDNYVHHNYVTLLLMILCPPSRLG